MNQFVCMNWGTAYGADYVNRLYSMIARNTQQPFRLVCYTDSKVGIRSEVECFDCPEVNIPSPKRYRGWRKLSLWANELPGLRGTALFLDLDIVITGGLDDFFSYRPEVDFCVIHNWTHPDRMIGNTSAYRFKVGSHPEILNWLDIDRIGPFDAEHEEQERERERVQRSAAQVDDGGASQRPGSEPTEDWLQLVAIPGWGKAILVHIDHARQRLLQLFAEQYVGAVGLSGRQPSKKLGGKIRKRDGLQIGPSVRLMQRRQRTRGITSASPEP